MSQSQAAPRVYDAIESLIRAAVPADAKVFQANMPFQVMGTLQREAARIVTYLITADKRRVNSSGSTPVHEITVDVNFFGSLADADDMANAFSDLVTGEEYKVRQWTIIIDQQNRRDIWEPQVAVKRVYAQFKGLAIAPENGTAG